ncbi:MAG TPA: methyltransferase domain-containing protein, partial [Desulfobulbus sp.]|nr:methyltransferase domain-containing protein [Desulfobulbus sp.]
DPGPGQQVLEMDPGMAFGTGQHASTRMALALVTATCRDQRPAAVLDVGTGTGILAMAAVLFGAGEAVAIDNDPEAVRVAAGNIRVNRLQDRIRVSGDTLDDCRGPFPLVCANIVHDVLVEMAPAFRRLLAPGGRIVLAGILAGEQEESIGRAYGRLGLQPVRSLHSDEWAALLLVDTSRRPL